MGHNDKIPDSVHRARRRARRRRLYRLRQIAVELAVVAIAVGAVAVPLVLHRRHKQAESSLAPTVSDTVSSVVSSEEPKVYDYPTVTADTFTLTDEVDAAYAILVDVTDNTVVAQKSPDTVVYPASVTKVMTLLVAVEHITDFTDTFCMTYDILHPLYLENATIAGFSEGGNVTLEDLLYGTILPSGADAAEALAEYIAGSEAQFAELMNEKAAQLHLKNTHFVNVSGLHDDNHYTTAEDMAMIMRVAMEDAHCRQVLSTYQYTTAVTPEHPEGILLTSTMFSRMYGDEPEGAVVTAGKTGYTTQAGHTMVSFAHGDDGHDYVLATMKGSNRWRATFDAIHAYTQFCGKNEGR